MKLLRSYWRVFYVNRYFHPGAPNDKLRTLFLLALVFGLWSWAMNQDYQDELTNQLILKESYRKIMRNCMTQADNGGNASFVIGNRAYALDCTLLSSDAHGGLRK